MLPLPCLEVLCAGGGGGAAFWLRYVGGAGGGGIDLVCVCVPVHALCPVRVCVCVCVMVCKIAVRTLLSAFPARAATAEEAESGEEPQCKRHSS